MEIKSYAADAIRQAKNLQEAFKANKTLSKRQKLTKRGVCVAYGIFKTQRENLERRNKQQPYFWLSYGNQRNVYGI